MIVCRILGCVRKISCSSWVVFCKKEMLAHGTRRNDLLALLLHYISAEIHTVLYLLDSWIVHSWTHLLASSAEQAYHFTTRKKQQQPASSVEERVHRPVRQLFKFHHHHSAHCSTICAQSTTNSTGSHTLIEQSNLSPLQSPTPQHFPLSYLFDRLP